MVRKEGKYWRVQIQRGGVPHSTTFQTRAEAQAFESKVIEDHKRKRTGTPVEYSLVQAFHRWATEELPTLKSKKFTKNHANQLLPFIRDNTPLTEIATVWAEYKKFALSDDKPKVRMGNGQYRRKGRLANATINRKGAILRRIANLALDPWGWIHTPINIELLPEPIKKAVNVLTIEDVQALTSVLDDPEFNRMVKVLFYSGMRVGEALRVRVINGTHFYIADTKNGRSHTIKIHEALMGEVQHLPFKFKYEYYQRRLIQARTEIGRPDITLHTLRHSFASHLLRKNVSLKTVSELLNHSSISITANVYGHISRPDLDDAISGF